MMLFSTETMKLEFAEASTVASCDAPAAFLRDCIAGLDAEQKMLPCKWLYDREGSHLFEAICDVPEYYPSRTEAALLACAAPEIAGKVAQGTALVEFGSGASRKTRTLLDAASAIDTYVPIDICRDELAQSCAVIRADYPALRVLPIHGDFTAPVALGAEVARRPLLGFFPGSTLGNFTPPNAADFLRSARRLLGDNARFLLGVDLRKDERTLVAAYDDSRGVTAAFNLNLLSRMNRELGCAIDLASFEHRAVWNGEHSRVEMHLCSLTAQSLVVGHRSFAFRAGETIHTESCHKYMLDGLHALAARSGWTIGDLWLSEMPSYALVMLVAA